MDLFQLVAICFMIVVMLLGIFSYMINYKNVKLLELNTKDLKDIIIIISNEVQTNSHTISSLADYNKTLYDVLGSLKTLVNNISDRLEQIETNMEPAILIPGPSLLSESNDPNTKDINKFNKDLPRQLQQIIELLKKYGSINRVDVENHLNCSTSTANRYLKDLKDKYKLIYMITDGKTTSYKLIEEAW